MNNVPSDPSGAGAETPAPNFEQARDAWRDFAEHVAHCVECGEMSYESCFDGNQLYQAARAADAGTLTESPTPTLAARASSGSGESSEPVAWALLRGATIERMRTDREVLDALAATLNGAIDGAPYHVEPLYFASRAGSVAADRLDECDACGLPRAKHLDGSLVAVCAVYIPSRFRPSRFREAK